VVIGGRRKFISAIIVPNLEKLQAYAKQNGVAYIDPRELTGKKEIQQFLLDEIDRATPHLAPYEKIKKILVLDRDFAVELEEMTPTLKVRRNLVEEKFKDLIDSLYRE
jgi:long-chain acyl-CoA synthetase